MGTGQHFSCTLDDRNMADVEDSAVIAAIVALWEDEEEQNKRTKGPDRLWLRIRNERRMFRTIVREFSAEDAAAYKSFMGMDVATFRGKTGKHQETWFNAVWKHRMFLPCSRNKLCFLETILFNTQVPYYSMFIPYRAMVRVFA